MKEFVIKLLLADKETLGTVRTYLHLQVALEEEWIWLRGIDVKAITDSKLRQLPSIHTFEIDEQGNLFPPGGFTPISRLKSLQWMPVGEFIQVELPTSAMPGQLSEKYQVKLAPSDKVKPGEALVTMLPVWKKYAHTAPEVRLNRLKFALSETGQVLILGTPLPTIPGKEYWLHDTILLPGGYDFEIPLICGLVAGKLNPLNDSLILFGEDGCWEKIPKAYVVPATRSAIRLTKWEEKA